jgi:hypothetical protein
MNEDLIKRIKQFNDIKYGNIDYPERTRIILARLKPQGTVTTAPNNKE